MIAMNRSKRLAWYWLSFAGLIGTMIGALVGGGVGALIVILGGHLFLLFSLVAAARGGVKGGHVERDISVSSRIGAFIIALIVALIIMSIGGFLLRV